MNRHVSVNIFPFVCVYANIINTTLSDYIGARKRSKIRDGRWWWRRRLLTNWVPIIIAADVPSQEIPIPLSFFSCMLYVVCFFIHSTKLCISTWKFFRYLSPFTLNFSVSFTRINTRTLIHLKNFCLSTMGNSKDLHTWRERV